MSRAELLERYRALPLPTTTEESWRFTDLKGFDPDAFVENGHHSGSDPDQMLDIDVSGLALLRGGGLEIERAPEGIRFEALDDSHPQLGKLVGTDEKFAAQNAARWPHGLLVHVPKGVELEQPLYVRVPNPPDGGAQFWRLLIVAEPGSRFSVIEEYAAGSAEAAGYSNAVVEIFVGQNAKVEYVSLQNLARDTWHFASHRARVVRDAELDWVAGGFGS
jgi:Fe-S cluster assembly scaffold protein SufB